MKPTWGAVVAIVVVGCGSRVTTEPSNGDAASLDDVAVTPDADASSVDGRVDDGDVSIPDPRGCPPTLPEFDSPCSRRELDECAYRGTCGRVELASCIGSRWSTMSFACADSCPAERPATGPCKEGAFCAWKGSCEHYEQWRCEDAKWVRKQFICD